MLQKLLLHLSILFFFSSCVKKENCYVDLGSSRERIYSIPDSILQFGFFTLDKSKIILQVNDTSHNKLLLDLQNGEITALDLSKKGFKGIYNNNYTIDSLAQRFWQNKDRNIEMYDTKTDKFYYFPKTYFNDVLFLGKKTVFTVERGLKIFDNQRFTMDSIKNVPPWNYVIEKENDLSIFINSDHRYNIKTGVLAQLSREEVRNRIAYCFDSESKEKKEKPHSYNPNIWDYKIAKQSGILKIWADTKNIYALCRGKFIVLNKFFWKKEDEYKLAEKEKTIDLPKTINNDESDEGYYAHVDINAFFALNTQNVSQNLSFHIRKLAYFKIWNKRFPKVIDTVSNKEKYYEAVRLQKSYDSLLLQKSSNDILLYHRIELVKKYYYLINVYHFKPTYDNIRFFEWETCQKILKQYPNSQFCDDIELKIFNKEMSNKENEYEYDPYTIKDISKLKKIIAKYPKTNLKKEFEFAMINTYRFMENYDGSDSTTVFNYNLKGAEMLIDFYKKNPLLYQLEENERRANYGIEKYSFMSEMYEELASLKFQKNIRIFLSTPKTEYNRKEPIIITYSIKNVGNENQEIETNEIDGLARYHLLFNVLNYKTEGCALDTVVYFQRILKENPKPTTRILKSGETISFQIDITKLANLQAKEFSTFENPLKYCYYPNSYGKLEFLKPLTLEIYIDKYYRITPSNKLIIKIK